MGDEKNIFGGYWTEQKINIFIKYLYAYLEIMKSRNFDLIYFDGFAGCGTIDNKGNEEGLIESVAVRVLSIDHPKRFTYYYLVEKSPAKKRELEAVIGSRFPHVLGTHVVEADCNAKLKGMSQFLKKNSRFRSLCFIDPFGMTVDWESIACFRDLGIDMWLLVPTGIGVNRMLTKSGKINDAWLKKLERFLGLDQPTIMEYFYNQTKEMTLFGEEDLVKKRNNSIEKIMDLYSKQLKTVFKYVSTPFPMKNTTGSVMYHFVLATNNKSGFSIGNDIIGKELRNISI